MVPDQIAEHIEIDPLLRHLWIAFLEMHRRRGSNGFQANPLDYTKIKDWMEGTRTKLLPWEIRAILAGDDAFALVQAETAKKRRPPAK